MNNLLLDWKKNSFLVNPVGNEAPIIAFLNARNITAKKMVFNEPPNMYHILVRRDLTLQALEKGLHVDKAEEPEHILVFGPDKQNLKYFLEKHGVKDVPVVGYDGEKVVQHMCRRLSEEEENAALEAGLLVGHVDYNHLLVVSLI